MPSFVLERGDERGAAIELAGQVEVAVEGDLDVRVAAAEPVWLTLPMKYSSLLKRQVVPCVPGPQQPERPGPARPASAGRPP